MTHGEDVVSPPSVGWAGLLAAKIQLEDREAGPRPMSREGAVFRHSAAATCAMALGLDMIHMPGTDMDLCGTWVTSAGTFIHDAWQLALQEWAAYNGVTAEVEVVCGFDDPVRTAGHADALVTVTDGLLVHRTCIELKTINGTGFRRAFVDGEGPRWSAVVQGALNAHSLGADELVVSYLAMEAISVFKGRDLTELERFSRDVVYDKETFTRIAEAELKRVSLVRQAVELGEWAPRQIPVSDGGWVQVEDPSSGKGYDDQGKRIKAWQCAYCKHQQTCVDIWRTE